MCGFGIGTIVKRNLAQRFLNGDNLWDLAEKHLLSVTPLIAQINKTIEEIDTHYKPEITLTGKETRITLQEKFPGAAEERPINLHVEFVFPPENPDSEKVRSGFKKLIETGDPTIIPEGFVESIELPEFVRAFLGIDRIENISLYISSIPGQRIIPVKVEFKCDDADSFTLNYIPLRLMQSGTKQLTFANDEQKPLVQVKLILFPEEGKVKINFKLVWKNLNVVQFLDNLILQRCLSKPVSVNLVSLESGITLFKVRKTKALMNPPESDFVDLIHKLAVLQKRIKRPIIFPDRDLSREEWQTIQELRQVLKEGIVEGTWSDLKIKIAPLPSSLGGFLRNFKDGKVGALCTTTYARTTLFGTELPLGPVEYTFKNALLVNFQELSDRFEELMQGNIEIELLFVSGEDKTVIYRYLEWIPNESLSTVSEKHTIV